MAENKPAEHSDEGNYSYAHSEEKFALVALSCSPVLSLTNVAKVE